MGMWAEGGCWPAEYRPALAEEKAAEPRVAVAGFCVAIGVPRIRLLDEQQREDALRDSSCSETLTWKKRNL
uniref:Uncharacterized protein n=1 Tax=Vespula pensylvanica TaxID=30213 RepID=A0A834P892_VESPE|nr:hypothetical protein H0235_004802 [Vespula pensylvanica]